MQIDVLVKNEKHVKLKKNIGRIFRQYNIIEYKSPEDGSGTGRQRHILPHRDAIPIQLVIVQKLSKEHNYWLNNLRNDLKAGSEIKKITETSYGKSSEKLNWDAIVSKKGETRVEHIKRHMVQNNSRETHSVFNGNPIDMVNDAWEQRHLVEPISDGMGGTIYNIPYKNAGYESGYINTGAQMDYITIVTLDESTDLITAFPSFGDYHK